MATLILSGILLFSDGPLRYYGNAAFRAKILLLCAASLSSLATHRIAARHKAAQTIPTAMRVMTALSLILWLGVGIAGRVIGVL